MKDLNRRFYGSDFPSIHLFSYFTRSQVPLENVTKQFNLFDFLQVFILIFFLNENTDAIDIP